MNNDDGRRVRRQNTHTQTHMRTGQKIDKRIALWWASLASLSCGLRQCLFSVYCILSFIQVFAWLYWRWYVKWSEREECQTHFFYPVQCTHTLVYLPHSFYLWRIHSFAYSYCVELLQLQLQLHHIDCKNMNVIWCVACAS